jgi:histidinol dehydrogenase
MIRVIDLRKGEEPPEPAKAALDDAVMRGAENIIRRVRAEGDAALVALTREFDGAEIGGRIAVTEDEFSRAAKEIDSELRDAIDAMAARLRDLHARQLPESWTADADGVTFGEVVKPVRAAGCYVPGGRASYPSTVLMTAIPARIAGVERVVITTPCKGDGSLPAAVLYAARAATADAVYRVGGAQAVAALAYGTETIEAVNMIVGPGNVWVTAAKRAVSTDVGIDSLAGPTELVVVADGTADPAVLAVDLLAQAEHDPEARSTLVSLDDSLPAAVTAHLEREVAASPRREIVEAALTFAAIVIAGDETTAAGVVDRLAPEHLQIVTADPRGFLSRVRSYGAAFLGPDTPVPFGDYGAGSNHVLPTMGTARFSSGLRAADFVTVSSVVEGSPDAVANVGRQIEVIAEAEGLPGHARTNAVRRRDSD